MRGSGRGVVSEPALRPYKASSVISPFSVCSVSAFALPSRLITDETPHPRPLSRPVVLPLVVRERGEGRVCGGVEKPLCVLECSVSDRVFCGSLRRRANPFSPSKQPL
ncbi:MAG: hypothetical protein BroJett007_35100 [Chloroflexota bacterium]|nr:MAG: hypothetical protein BroJett007_35100 [Chloroflexota bacterium]